MNYTTRKEKEGSCRPVPVEIQNEKENWNIGRAKLLRYSTKDEGIYISPVLTVQEKQYIRTKKETENEKRRK